MPDAILNIIADGAAEAEESALTLLEQYDARFYVVLNDPAQRDVEFWAQGFTAQGMDPNMWMGLTPQRYNQTAVSQRTPLMDAALSAIVGLAHADANYTVVIPQRLKAWEAQAKRQNASARRTSSAKLKSAAMEGPRERFAEARERRKVMANAGTDTTTGE